MMIGRVSLRKLVIAMVHAGVLVARSFGQPVEIGPPAEVGPPAPALAALALYHSLERAYATSQVEERVTIVATADTTAAGTSEIVWRCAPSASAPPTLRVELGPLIIHVSGGVLTAIHAQNPGTYFVASLGAPQASWDGGALRQILAPIPLPQAAWTLGPLAAGALGQMLPAVAWGETLVGLGGECPTQAFGDIGGNVVRFRATRGTEPRLCEWSGPAAIGSPITLKLLCEQLPASEPGTWAIDVQGRQRVMRLSDLRPAPPRVMAGQRVPTMGLMTAELQSWSLEEALSTVSDGPLNTASPLAPVETFAVLILDDHDLLMGVTEAARAAAVGLRVELDRARHQGRTTLPRFFVRVVHVLDVPRLNDPNSARARLAANPLPTSEPSTIPLFSSAGKGLLEQFAPGTSVVAVVVASNEKLAAAIPVEQPGVAFDSDEFVKRLRDVVVGPVQ